MPAKSTSTVRPLTRLPVHRRNIGMLFQNYALFPHMTVAQNIALGLETPGLRRAAIAGRVDEPLCALDESLRQNMQVEPRALQRRLGITAVMVTHDQDEALTMADQIVMRDGQIEQVGKPQEVYQRPSSRFTASFLGAANFFRGCVTENRGGVIAIEVPGGPRLRLHADRTVGHPVTVALRAEALLLRRAADDDGGAPNTTPAVIDQVVYHGFVTHLHLRLPAGDALLAFARDGSALDGVPLNPGLSVIARWSDDAVHVLRDAAD